MNLPISTAQAHGMGLCIFLAAWAILPMLVVRAASTSMARLSLAVWYVGIPLAFATYLVTR